VNCWCQFDARMHALQQNGVYTCTMTATAMKTWTRKLCYRKDDRAMRPIHGCPENFLDSLTTLTATIPNIVDERLFQLTLWMFLQNLKPVTLPVPDRMYTKIWAVPGYAHAPFYPKFLMDFYTDWACKSTRQIWSP